MYRSAGIETDELADLNSNQETTLGNLVAEKYQADFFILDQVNER